jgi:hypothetical protein
LTVGKSQDPAWKDVLDTKGLSAAATILEEYGLYFNATFGEDQKNAFGDYLELGMQSQYNKRNL